MNGYFDGWWRFWQFSGRASRGAFLTFFLGNMLISAVFVALEAFYLTAWKFEVIYSLLILLPMLSLTVRRLHDTNRSAWWLLVILVPVVGMVLWLILMVLPSEPPSNDNAYSQHDTTL